MDRYFNITFIRHGEAENNLPINIADPELYNKIYDAPLTDLGIKQSNELHNKLHNHNFDVIYVSPLERTLKTCSITFDGTSIPILSNELIREYKDSYANYRKNIYEKTERYPNINFKEIDDNDDTMQNEEDKYRQILCFNILKKTKVAYMIDRVYKFIEILSKSDHRNICIVSHLGFIYMFGHLLDYNLRPNNGEICKIRVRL